MAEKKEKRFVKAYSQGGFANPSMEVWVDRQTGVNYLWTASGYAGGLTVMLNRDGTPIVTSVPREDEE